MPKKRTSGAIPAPEVPIDQRRLRFSLQYLALDHPRFPVDKCSKTFFEALFREILRYQSFTVDCFMYPEPRDHRHAISFESTSERKGFPIDPTQDRDLWTETAWQFGLTDGNGRHNGWRVHGFITEEFFHIVWLDPNHQLNPKPAPSSQ